MKKAKTVSVKHNNVMVSVNLAHLSNSVHRINVMENVIHVNPKNHVRSNNNHAHHQSVILVHQEDNAHLKSLNQLNKI